MDRHNVLTALTLPGVHACTEDVEYVPSGWSVTTSLVAAPAWIVTNED